MRRILLSLLFILTVLSVKAVSPDTITIIYTTDVHGSYFPYDFIKGVPTSGSLARVATVVDKMRGEITPDRVLVLDDGDFLQGQPCAYYYNFIDTVSPHLAARIFNHIGYNAIGEGNHDIETGHAVYDRVASQLDMPTLAANVIDRATGEPYFTPYIIQNVGGRKIAIIGLLTPAIPAWLPERLWSGLEFQEMVPAARYWVDKVRSEHRPDIVIGLFHSGHNSAQTTAGYRENESLEIARQVEGFDAVLMGHDHREYCDTVAGPDGRAVWALNPAANAQAVGVLNIAWNKNTGRPTLDGSILSLRDVEPSASFMTEFAPDFVKVKEFVEQPVTRIAAPMRSTDALKGPSAMMTLLHELQLDVTGAQISLAAPLSLDSEIAEGVLTMADMFKLYKYENNLCTLRLTGREILGHLEESYRQWLDTDTRYPLYNYDSAMGIDYTVDRNAEPGKRVNILSLSDGTPFDLAATYTVAVNSYRAGGGGNHLTLGAGLSSDELLKRNVATTPKDIRYYLINYLRSQPEYRPHIVANWHFINR